MTRVVLGWLSAGVLALVLAIYGIDLLTYVRSPHAYTFGTEVAGLLYRSSTHFVTITVITIFLCVLGLAAPFLWRNRDIATGVRLALGLVVAVVAIGLAVAARS